MHCLFGGEVVDSEEHVVPRWLQRRFELGNQKIRLPNGTFTQYKHLKVPAAADHNSSFGQIEDRISRGRLTPIDLYLWCFKLHIGLIYRDTSLKANIKDPQSPTILNVDDFEDQLILFRNMYRTWRHGGTFDPDPPGSVFVVDSPAPKSFELFHCLLTGTVGVNIGRKFVLSFLWDQGDGLHAPILDQWETVYRTYIRSAATRRERRARSILGPRVWACEAAYWLFRNRRTHAYLAAPNSFILLPPMARQRLRPPLEDELRLIAYNFGLDLVEFGGPNGNRYSFGGAVGA